jgi:hypothetical protein
VNHLFATNTDIVEVTYHDRYLNSPLPVSLLLEFISGVKTVLRRSVGGNEIQFDVIAVFLRNHDQVCLPTKYGITGHILMLEIVLVEAAFEFSGIEASVISRNKQDAIHARRLGFHA